MDAYFKPEGDRPTATGRTGRSYRDDNNPESFDLPRLRRDVSDAAENGSCRVLIVEGLLTLWDCGLYEQLDLRLFVDCRADERIVRRLKRNMQWGYTFDEIADVYLDLVRTEARHVCRAEPMEGGPGHQRQRLHGQCAGRPRVVHPNAALTNANRTLPKPKASDFLCLYGFSATTRRVNFPHCLEKTKHSAPPVKATANQSRIVLSQPKDSENAAIP